MRTCASNRWATWALAAAFAVPAHAGPIEEASALVEQAQAARGKEARVRLLQQALALDPLHPAANERMAAYAEFDRQYADCVRFQERAAEGLGREPRSAVDAMRRLEQLQRAMACAARSTDLAEFDRLKAQLGALEGTTPVDAVEPCQRAAIGTRRLNVSLNLQDVLVDRIVFKYSAGVERPFVCSMLPRLRDNLQGARQAMAQARSIRNCASANAADAEAQLNGQADQIVHASKFVRDLDGYCAAR